MPIGSYELRKGDEVLVRGRVLDPAWYENPLVELYSKEGPYPARVRRDSIETVVPLEETRTHRGYTVSATRLMIGHIDGQLRDLAAVERDAESPAAHELAQLERAVLMEVREGLAADLTNVGALVDAEAA